MGTTIITQRPESAQFLKKLFTTSRRTEQNIYSSPDSSLFRVSQSQPHRHEGPRCSPRLLLDLLHRRPGYGWYGRHGRYAGYAEHDDDDDAHVIDGQRRYGHGRTHGRNDADDDGQDDELDLGTARRFWTGRDVWFLFGYRYRYCFSVFQIMDYFLQ